jgi:hypothetical protein
MTTDSVSVVLRSACLGNPDPILWGPRGRHPLSNQAAAERGSETAVGYTWMMPKIFEQDGYSFFFYSNDHAPIHVHVRRGGGEAVFVVEPEVELRESVGFNVRELSRAEDLIDDHLELIKQKWAEHLG